MAETEFTEVNVADHREAAIAAIKPIASKLDEIYSGANCIDSEAWDLFGTASTKATEAIEVFEEQPFHAGVLMIRFRGIVAAMRGAQLILEEKGDSRTVEEEGAFSLVSRFVPQLRACVEALEEQSFYERGGSKSAEAQHG